MLKKASMGCVWFLVNVFFNVSKDLFSVNKMVALITFFKYFTGYNVKYMSI